MTGVQSNSSDTPVGTPNHEDTAAADVSEPLPQKIIPAEEEMSIKIKNSRSETLDLTNKPTREEVWFWYLYELCSYFIHTVLIPMVFPLLIAYVSKSPPQAKGWVTTTRGFPCWSTQIDLYTSLTNKRISFSNAKFSPLEWTAFSWAIGLVLVTPAFGFISNNLDYGWNQQLIAGAATAAGAFFCLPVGFFRTNYIYPFYIVPIIAAITIATAFHSRHLGLMVRSFTGPNLEKNQFNIRRGISSWLSLLATAAGCLGCALISTFIYYMLRIDDKFTGLWIVSIFSGLKWVAGTLHIVSLRPGEPVTGSSIPRSHSLSIFKHPHAVGSLIVVALSSFTTMCVFGGGLLFLLGELCLKPRTILYLWLIYFILPSVSLPLVHLIRLVIKSNAVKMQILAFILSLITSGFGFYFRGGKWKFFHVLIFGALQGTSVGILHAFGRVLVLDCSPRGQEGAFSIWFSWMKMAGTCAGYALASRVPGDIKTCFATVFLTGSVGILVLIFGNISDVGGAIAAGIVRKDGENGSVRGSSSSAIKKRSVEKEVL